MEPHSNWSKYTSKQAMKPEQLSRRSWYWKEMADSKASDLFQPLSAAEVALQMYHHVRSVDGWRRSSVRELLTSVGYTRSKEIFLSRFVDSRGEAFAQQVESDLHKLGFRELCENLASEKFPIRWQPNCTR
uniref:Uncharacterized protein n=1 Tax=Tetraselmis sp. GSL018 TaxID=582737 RepID=A0A061SGW3_9CHLO